MEHPMSTAKRTEPLSLKPVQWNDLGVTPSTNWLTTTQSIIGHFEDLVMLPYNHGKDTPAQTILKCDWSWRIFKVFSPSKTYPLDNDNVFFVASFSRFLLLFDFFQSVMLLLHRHSYLLLSFVWVNKMASIYFYFAIGWPIFIHNVRCVRALACCTP